MTQTRLAGSRHSAKRGLGNRAEGRLQLRPSLLLLVFAGRAAEAADGLGLVPSSSPVPHSTAQGRALLCTPPTCSPEAPCQRGTRHDTGAEVQCPHFSRGRETLALAQQGSEAAGSETPLRGTLENSSVGMNETLLAHPSHRHPLFHREGD